MAGGRALPVTLLEFSHALSAICNPARTKQTPQRIALAISGGVDSMALAHLSMTLHQNSPDMYDFTALVVDHKSRQGSSEEVERTCSTLRQLGLKANLLSISWDDTDPAALLNFESTARKYRYAILRDECIRLQIDRILTAHHLDDQVETIFMRLTQGYTGYGLGGIHIDSMVPERSPTYNGAADLHSSVSKCLPHMMFGDQHGYETPFAGTISSSIRIGRPLLGFAKDRLISTCANSNVPWAEDPTNADKTLTPRNAIRNLFERNLMPKAFGKDSLLRLGSNVSNARQELHDIAATAFERTSVLSFDPRTGVLTIIPPTPMELSDCIQAERYAQSKPFRLKVAMTLTKMIADIVTPQANLQIERFARVSELMFPQYDCVNAQATRAQDQTEKRITAGGILWEKSPSNPTWKTFSWRLSRQPPIASDRQLYCQWDVKSIDPAHWQPWQLFDGRFWIRIRRPLEFGSRLIAARRFTQQDIARLRSSVPHRIRKTFDEVLSAAAPGAIRWTLPVLVDHDDIPIALPTIGFTTSQRNLQLTWEFAYRDTKLPKGLINIPQP